MKKFALIAALVVIGFPALADTMTATDPTAIYFRPLFDFLNPILTAIVLGIVTVVTPLLTMKILAWLHINTTEAQRDKITKLAQTAAGGIVASAEATFSDAVIHVNDPRIVAAANSVIQRAGPDAKALGVTPAAVQAAVQDMVHGEVGKLQSLSPTTAVTVNPMPISVIPKSPPRAGVE